MREAIESLLLKMTEGHTLHYLNLEIGDLEVTRITRKTWTLAYVDDGTRTLVLPDVGMERACSAIQSWEEHEARILGGDDHQPQAMTVHPMKLPHLAQHINEYKEKQNGE